MYSLWLIPDIESQFKLSEALEYLADYGNALKFDPHVPLLSGIYGEVSELDSLCIQFAQTNTALQIRIDRADYLDMYYRGIFLKSAYCEELHQMREAAQDFFPNNRVEPFIPTISFLYGDAPKFAQDKVTLMLPESLYFDFNLPVLRLVKTSNIPDSYDSKGEYSLMGE